MYYARITQEGVLESAIFSQQEIEQGCAEGFKPLIINHTQPNISGLQGIEVHYEQSESDIVMSYVVVENHPIAVEREISQLQKLLSADDYKIVKCQEYALVGEPLPYDMKTLHVQRDRLRAQINELQTLNQ